MYIVSSDSSGEKYDVGRDLNAIVINRTYSERTDSFDATVEYFGVRTIQGLPINYLIKRNGLIHALIF